MKALIIVDVQNDFLPGGALEVPKGDDIIPVINSLIMDYPLVVATQDWHPQNHQSFASQHAEHQTFDLIDLNGLPQILWPDHCIQGSAGADFAADLNTKPIEAIFRKGMDKDIDSYSGFYDNGRRKATGLAGYLKERGVSEVHICGLAADFCVYFTAMDSLQENLKTVILSKATKAIDKSQFIDKKEQFIRQGGLFI